MLRSAIANAYNMVRIDCADQLVDRQADLSIKDTTLHRVKEVFNHFRMNVFEGLAQLIEEIHKHHTYSHAIFFYDEETYPCEVLMVREMVTENNFSN